MEDPVFSGMTIIAKTLEVVGRLPSGMSVACVVNKGIRAVVCKLELSRNKYVLFKGSLDKAHKGLEFRQDCISASNVGSSL